MHSWKYIIAGMHSLECILKIEDPNAALVYKWFNFISPYMYNMYMHFLFFFYGILD